MGDKAVIRWPVVFTPECYDRLRFASGGILPVAAKIIIGDLVLETEFFDTSCATAIAAALPLNAYPQVWGDEFYFTIPVAMPIDETATARVKVGDIGYWPPGNALAIFFGPTPMSTGPDPVPTSEVNLVGRIAGDAALLKSHKGAKRIRIE